MAPVIAVNTGAGASGSAEKNAVVRPAHACWEVVDGNRSLGVVGEVGEEEFAGLVGNREVVWEVMVAPRC